MAKEVDLIDSGFFCLFHVNFWILGRKCLASGDFFY